MYDRKDENLKELEEEERVAATKINKLNNYFKIKLII